MNIVFLDTATLSDLPQQLTRFEELGQFTAYETTEPERTVERSKGADVVISNKVYLGEAELAELTALKLICIAATGKNNVDLEAAKKRGIPVRNVSGYSTESVAQITLTTFFALSMDLLHLNDKVYDGSYATSPSFSYWRRPFYELKGKRWGIIGLGDIGQRVAELVKAYGGEVVYHSTSGKNLDQPYPHLPLEELLATSHVVSIHCPLHPRTRHLIGAKELQALGPDSYLVNVARGGIVDEAALVKALNDKQIAGAAFDVFTEEPMPDDHVFHQMEDQSRLLLTPHIAWASVEARTQLVDGIIANIRQGW